MKSSVSIYQTEQHYAIISHQRMKLYYFLSSLFLLMIILGCLLQWYGIAYLSFGLSVTTILLPFALPQHFALRNEGICHSSTLPYRKTVHRWNKIQQLQLIRLKYSAIFSLYTWLMYAMNWKLIRMGLVGKPDQYFWCKEADALMGELEFSLFESETPPINQPLTQIHRSLN